MAYPRQSTEYLAMVAGDGKAIDRNGSATYQLVKDESVEQLLLHLIGDYITQTDWMAREKVKRTFAAMVHVTVYTIPFLALTRSPLALFTIWSTHLLIDRFRLARYLVFFKNWITQPSLKWQDCRKTGYPDSAPVWLSVWLMIITDNTLHLMTNYAALRWL